MRSEEDKLLSLMMQMQMRNGHFIVMAMDGNAYDRHIGRMYGKSEMKYF